MAASKQVGDLTLTKDLKLYERRNRLHFNTTEKQRQIDQWIQYQEQLEKKYIDSTQSCPIRKLSDYQDKFGAINSNEYKKVIRKNFYNSNVMEEAMCLADSIVYSQAIEVGAISSNERIRRWLDRMTQIGEASVEGFALETDFNKTEDVFVVKVPRDPENKDLLHEYFVGLQLNTLRKKIPNFAYIMGGFKCSPPVIDDIRKDAVMWCSNSNVNVHYILYENISPAVTMTKYIATCTFQQWLDKYLQVLYSLHLAHQEMDFTHYDLHPSNVLIREINPDDFSDSNVSTSDLYSIPYQTERGGIEYINTDGVATIIDYGNSHVVYKNKHYGKYRLLPWGVNPQNSSILHDAYKLLMFSMLQMTATGNTECLNGAINIFKFFNSVEDPNTVIIEQRPLYYFLPYNDKVKELTILDLTGYIRRYIPESNMIMSDQLLHPMIGCNGPDLCITNQEAITRMGIGDKMEVKTVFDFYDLSTRLTGENRTNEAESLKDSFDYREAKRMAIEDYNTLSQKTVGLAKNLIPVEASGRPSSSFFDSDFLNTYRDFVIDTATLFDSVQRLAILKDAIEYTSDKFGDTKLTAVMTSHNDAIRSYLQPVSNAIASINRDITYINGLKMNRPEYVEEGIKQSSMYKWWWDTLPVLARTIS